MALMMAGLVVVAAAWRFGTTIADPDLWGHVLGGLDSLEAGSYIRTDLYSYLTEGRTLFKHEWFGEVIMGGVFSAFGSAGLTSLKALIALSIVVVLVWWLLRHGLSPLRTALVGLLVALVLTPTFGTFRPQIFTVLCLVVLLLIMVRVETGGQRLLWLLPPLFLAWVNLHGGVLAGLAVGSTWAILHAWRPSGRGRFGPLIAMAGSIAAATIHPNGWRHLLFLVETTAVPRPEIQDWQPIDLASPVGLVYAILALITVVAVVADRRKVDLALALPLLALTLAPLLSWRHLQLFAPAVVLLGGPHLVALSARFGSKGADRVGNLQVVGVTMMTLVVLISVTVGTVSPCVQVEATQFEVPQRAVAAWSTVNPSGNAVVPFNWGEYTMWHLGPDIQVSSDGRRETIYSEEVHQANLNFMSGGEGWEELLDLAPADWILAPTASPVLQLIAATGDWHLAYQDSLATIYATQAVVLNGNEAVPIDGDGSCFPA